MIESDILIINKLGLHARAAAKMVSTASRFKSKIHLVKGERKIDAKSIMSLLMLGASQGTSLGLRVEGDDAEQAHEAIVALVNDRFGEAE